MNTDAILSGIVTALAVAAVLVLLPKVRKVRAQEQGPDVGVAVFDVEEDINNPTIATIDLALAHMDRDSDPDAVDWLLERRLAAMRREGVSWPSI